MRTAHILMLIPLLLVANIDFAQTALPTAMEDTAFTAYFFNREHIPVVKGKIVNLSAAEISKIKIDYTLVTPFEELQRKNSCSLQPDGSFELKLDYAFPYQQIWITVGDLFYTGIYANTSLYIELDAAVLKTQKDLSFNGPGVKYLGPDGALNTYTNDHILFRSKEQQEINSQLQTILPLSRTDYAAFIKKYDSLFILLTAIDNAYIKQTPGNFGWLLTNERLSDYYDDLCTVHWGKQMPPELFEKVSAHTPYAVSNDGMLFYNYLFMYVRTTINKRRQAEKKISNVTDATVETIALADSLFTPAKADILKLQFPGNDPQEYKQRLEIMLPLVKTAWCKAVMKDEYEKTADRMTAINKILSESKPVASRAAPGTPVGALPFGARLYKVGAIKADSLLSMIKNSFKNKALLIDCWATWCGPCMAEFPHSKKLSAECKDLPVEFVYICTSEGSDEAKWKSKIAELKIGGTHIFADKSTVTAFMSLFSKSGYPSYMLINTKGQYKPGAITRPSDTDREKLAAAIQ